MNTLIIIALVFFGILGLGFSIFVYRMAISDGDTLSICVGWVIIVVIIIFTICFSLNFYVKSQCVVKTTIVSSDVIDKEYTEPYTTYMLIGKVMTPTVYSAKYNVTIKYKNITTELDNQELYNKLTVGSKIQMKLLIYTQPNGKVYEEDLMLP